MLVSIVTADPLEIVWESTWIHVPSLRVVMVRFTQLVRVSDALPLAQSVEDDQSGIDLTKYKQQARTIYSKLTPSSETRCTIESGPMALQYVGVSNKVT